MSDSSKCAQIGFSPATLPSLFIPNTYYIYWDISVDHFIERAQVEKDMFNSLRSDWNDEHAPVFTGMYTCEKCNGRRTSSKEIQMRSADEPMTIFKHFFDTIF